MLMSCFMLICESSEVLIRAICLQRAFNPTSVIVCVLGEHFYLLLHRPLQGLLHQIGGLRINFFPIADPGVRLILSFNASSLLTIAHRSILAFHHIDSSSLGLPCYFPPLKPWLPHCRDPPLQSCMAQKSMLANNIGSPSAPVSSLVSCSICSQMAGQPPELPSTSNETREASKKPSYQEFSCIWGRGRIIQVLITHGVAAEIQAFFFFPEIPSQLLNYCC